MEDYEDASAYTLIGRWFVFFFSSRRRHTRCSRDWSSDVCSSDLSMEEQWDLAGLEKALESEWRIQLPLQSQVQSAHAITDEEILEKVLQAAREVFEIGRASCRERV